MPAASSPPGAGLRKVKRRKSSGYANPRERAMYGGSRKSRVVRAAKVETGLRRGRRIAAVKQFKRTRKPGSTATLSVKQEATALRTLARRASTPQEWKQLQGESPTGQALPGIEKKVKDRRNQEIFDALPKPLKTALTAEADARFATQVFKYAKTLPDFPKPELQRLRKVAFNKRQNAQGMKLRLAEGSADINAKSPLIGLDKKGNINRIGPDPRLDGNSIDNIISDLIPDQPWEIALTVGAASAGPAVSGVVRAGKVAKDAARATRIGKAATRVRRIRQAAVASVGSKTGATAARNAAKAAAARATAKVPTAVKKGAVVGARAGSYPVRRPIQAGLAANTANVYSQTAGGASLGEAIKRPQQGIATALTSPAVGAVGVKVLENFLRDLQDLPLNMLPSLFLAGKASVQAVNGNDKELNALVQDYIKTGFLPNAIKGDWEAAGEAAVNHPLYVALGASGGYAIVGRTAGTALRLPGKYGVGPKGVRKTLNKVAGLKRDPLKLDKTGQYIEQEYSKNLITKAIQKGIETGLKKRGKDPFYYHDRPKAWRPREKYERKMAVAVKQSGQEGARRKAVDAAPDPLYKEEPSLADKVGRLTSRTAGMDIPNSLRETAVNIVNAVIRKPETARADMKKAKARWQKELDADARAKAAAPNSKPPVGWTPDQIANTKANIDAMNQALRATDEEIAQVFATKERYGTAHRQKLESLVRAGKYTWEQIRTATVRPFAVHHMGARSVTRWMLRGQDTKRRWNTEEDARQWAEKNLKAGESIDPIPVEDFVDAKGRKLPVEKVEAEMKRQGVTAHFVTERPRFKGWRGKYYQAVDYVNTRSNPDKRRSGKASAKGWYNASAEMLADQLIATTTMAHKIEGIGQLFGRFLARNDGELVLAKSYEDSFAFLTNEKDGFGWGNPEYGLDPNVRYRAVRIPNEVSDTQISDAGYRILESPSRYGARVSDLESMDQANLDALVDPRGPGQWGFVEETTFKTAQGLARPRSDLEKILSAWNNVFKGVILPVSPRWIIGNMIDPAIRGLLEGLLPIHWIVNRNMTKYLEEHKPEILAELDIPLYGGTWVGDAINNAVRERDPERYRNMEYFGDFLTWMASIPERPGLSVIANGYRIYRKGMFSFNQAAFETSIQKGVVGKALLQKMYDLNYSMKDALNAGGPAYRDLAKGLEAVPSQVAYAKKVWQTLGRWNSLTRAEKDGLSYAAPFGLWLKAAYQFVAITLPRHHPIKVAIGAQIAQMTEEERMTLGLSKFSETPVQSWNMGSAPIQNDKWYRPQFASSFGMFTDPADVLQSSIFSQFSGIFDALRGVDWKGDQLVSTGLLFNDEGRPLEYWEKGGLALVNLIEVMVPLVGVVTRLSDNKLPDQIAKTYYALNDKEKSKFLEDRFLPFLGVSTLDAKGIEDSKKHYGDIKISIPNPNPPRRVRPSSGSSNGSWSPPKF